MDQREQWMAAVQARLERVTTTHDLHPVLEETALYEARELSRTITDDPGSLPAMYILGWLHWYRYQALPEGHDQQDLQAAVSMFTPCFMHGTSGLPGPLLPLLADLAIRVATQLLELTQRTGDLELLTATAGLWRRIVAATPADHPGRAERLSNLAAALRARFRCTEVLADLDAAIDAWQQALNATPADHPDRAAILSNLGNALRVRFERTGATTDLDAAIDAGQQAVDATPADHPDRARILSNFGNALVTRFERTRVAADLDAAIDTAQQALNATPADHPDRAAILSNLGNALRIRFERTGAAADLDAAIDTAQQALNATPADHPDRAGRLSNLGNALRTRFERTGATADLDAAIHAGQQAVHATPADHPNRAAILSNLGNALRTRYERTGATADLDAAIHAGQQAVHATPADRPDRAAILSNLGNALQARYERTGASTDLDAAVDTAQQALNATPADHPDRAGCLSNLGDTLRTRYGRTGAIADLDAAIDTAQQAINATPADHPDRAGWLSSLGNALQARYERTGATADLDAAIHAGQQAVNATPADHPSRARRLSNLGNALRTRYERTGAIADLDAAIDTGQQAVNATPADHPSRAGYLFNLGNALRARFERTEAAKDLDAAFQRYSEATSVDMAAASVRIGAGYAAARLVTEADPGRAASLLEAAVLLLPEVAARFLERGDQQYAIGRFAGLAAEAAAAALSDPAMPELQRPARALGLLEAARGVLLSQALSTRGDLSELRDRHPELARRFTELRDWLDQPSPATSTDLVMPGNGSVDAQRYEIRDRRQAAAEFTQLLARIRDLDGFAAFALPPSAEQLETQGGQGPVVVFNVAAHRSDAILLTSDGITSHPLPELNQAKVIDQIGAFHRALGTITGTESPLAGDDAESPLAGDDAEEALRQVLGWLWDNAAGPVLHALGYQDPPPPGQPWPQVVVEPGGLLSLLPVHAAGHHIRPAGSRRPHRDGPGHLLLHPHRRRSRLRPHRRAPQPPTRIPGR